MKKVMLARVASQLSMLRSPSQKSGQLWATCSMYWKLLQSYDLIGISCVNACAMRMEREFLETRPQNAAVQFLSGMARSVSCLWTISVVLHSHRN